MSAEDHTVESIKEVYRDNVRLRRENDRQREVIQAVEADEIIEFMEEKVAEAERLRATLTSRQLHAERQRGEVDRLREALSKIRDDDGSTFLRAQHIARAALEDRG